MRTPLSILIENLDDIESEGLRVIPWASPVPVFGDYTKSKVATLGLNPSNKEFVDTTGKELSDKYRRLHTLSSLGLDNWSHITDHHFNEITDSCRNYFSNNPYNNWFKTLDNLISGTASSYYGHRPMHACHLDLIPYVTSCKWAELNIRQKNSLINLSHEALAHLLRDSSVELLILNGKSVVDSFQELSGINLNSNEKIDWALPRKNNNDIKGYSFTGKFSSFSGLPLDRKITVLGFNHNIQSSFGVTNKVKHSIKEWISSQAEKVSS